MKERPMKRAKKTAGRSDMLKEYDFRKGERGRYLKRLGAGRGLVLLSPEVAELFPDSESVNQALRLLVRIAKRQTRKVTA